MVGRMINHYVIGFLVYPESLERGYMISESDRIVAAVFFFRGFKVEIQPVSQRHTLETPLIHPPRTYQR